MAYVVPEHHVLQFSSNVEFLSQQKDSRMESCVDVQSFVGENAEVVVQYASVAMSALTDHQGATVLDTIAKDNRWCFPGDKVVTLPVTRADDLRMIYNPKSPLVRAVVNAYNREKDDVIIAAATGSAQTGKYDALAATALPSTQKLGGAATDNFSVAFIKTAWQKLMQEETEEDEEAYMAVSAKDLRHLLDDSQITSKDYSEAQALVDGKIDKFMGFNFKRTERLNTYVDTETYRQCFAWKRSGLCLGKWQKDGTHLMTRMSERADLNYLWQVHGQCTLGATRTEEVKVVEIDVDTATDLA